MDESEWAPGPASLPRTYGSYEYELEVCPGRIVRTDAVTEGAVAHSASQSGQLAVYFPEQENVILEAATVAQMAFNEYEAERVKRRAEEAKR